MRRHSVLRSTAIISVCTTLSRVLGLLREILMARFFGTTLPKSAFDIAFKIPNLFRRLFGEGALSAAFIPIFTESLEKEGVEKANGLAGKIMTMLAVVLAAVVILVVLLSAALLNFVELDERTAAVLPLLQITIAYTFFICLVGLCMAILNSFNHFTLPAATPVLLNIVWIFSLLFVCPRMGDMEGQQIYGVAWAVLAAGVVQLAVQYPVLRRFGLCPKLSFSWDDPRVRKVLLLMGPAAVGVGVMQINVVVDGILALFVGTWAPAALTYAERLIYLPLGIFATALGTVLLPTFSRHAAREENDRIRTTLRSATQTLMLVMVPAAVGLLVLAPGIVEAIFQRGRFDSRSTLLTARALRFYAPGLVTFSLYKLLVPVFYSQQDTATPVRLGVKMVALNFVLNVLFIITWPEGFKHAGLAYATVISSTISCVVLAILAERLLGPVGWQGILGAIGRIILASCGMGAVAHIVHSLLKRSNAFLSLGTEFARLLTLSVAVVAAIAVYAVLAFLLCRGAIVELLASWRNRRDRRD